MIMSNIGVPSISKRRVLLEVVHSSIFYATPIWHRAMKMKKYRDMLIATQRKKLLRAICECKTVSAAALQIIAGVPPIHLLVKERRSLMKSEEQNRAQAKRELRKETYRHCQ